VQETVNNSNDINDISRCVYAGCCL